MLWWLKRAWSLLMRIVGRRGYSCLPYWVFIWRNGAISTNAEDDRSTSAEGCLWRRYGPFATAASARKAHDGFVRMIGDRPDNYCRCVVYGINRMEMDYIREEKKLGSEELRNIDSWPPYDVDEEWDVDLSDFGRPIDCGEELGRDSIHHNMMSMALPGPAYIEEIEEVARRVGALTTIDGSELIEFNSAEEAHAWAARMAPAEPDNDG